MENKTIVDKHFIRFREFMDGSEDKIVTMTYFKNEKTNKKAGGVKNPYYDKIVKMTTVEFTYGRKYSEEVKSTNPDYEFKGSKTEYTKFEGNDILEKNVKGELSLGIVDPKNTNSEFFVWNEDGSLESWDAEKRGNVYDYLPQRKPYGTPQSGVIYRRYKYTNIQSLTVGNTHFINPDFLKENESIN